MSFLLFVIFSYALPNFILCFSLFLDLFTFLDNFLCSLFIFFVKGTVVSIFTPLEKVKLSLIPKSIPIKSFVLSYIVLSLKQVTFKYMSPFFLTKFALAISSLFIFSNCLSPFTFNFPIPWIDILFVFSIILYVFSNCLRGTEFISEVNFNLPTPPNPFFFFVERDLIAFCILLDISC
jgi:hypothetical protein